MDNLENLHKFLEWMDRPAFYVREGVILAVNQAAAARMIQTGTAVESLLDAAAETYRSFSNGTLSLPLTVGATVYTACVEQISDGQLFLLSPENEDRELQALALAAQQLRLPLNQAMSAADALLSSKSDDSLRPDPLASMNRSLYQMLRIVLNMSDSHHSVAPRMELVDLTAVFQEIFDRSAELFCQAGVQLHFVNHPQSIYSLADSSRLERAAYNLLSNALKHVSAGAVVEASLSRRGAQVYLTVTDPGGDLPAAPGAFSRFLREPGLEDCRTGLGLGMRLVQSAAAAHGGTVLMEPLPCGGMRVTVSLVIRQRSDQLRSSALRIDYAGERDHALIEFSDLLPDRLYGR